MYIVPSVQKYKSYQTAEIQPKTVFCKNGQLKDKFNTWLFAVFRLNPQVTVVMHAWWCSIDVFHNQNAKCLRQVQKKQWLNKDNDGAERPTQIAAAQHLAHAECPKLCCFRGLRPYLWLSCIFRWYESGIPLQLVRHINSTTKKETLHEDKRKTKNKSTETSYRKNFSRKTSRVYRNPAINRNRR